MHLIYQLDQTLRQVVESLDSVILHIYYSFDTGEYHESVGYTANQTSDILRYPLDNKFIRYCSCANTLVTRNLPRGM